MTDELITRIIRHEGFCEFPKPDTMSMWVVGYGHDITGAQAIREYADGITEADALKLLEADIARFTDQVKQRILFYAELDQTRQDILVEMAFQMGIEGLLQFRHMLNAMEGEDWDAAAKAMLDSEWRKQTPARCEELAGLMLRGNSPLA